MKPKDKKSKRAQSPYDFCPKHNVFFASCKCLQKKQKVDKPPDDEPEAEMLPLEDNE